MAKRRAPSLSAAIFVDGPKSAKRLARDTIEMGGQALLICKEMATSAATLIRDNRKLMEQHHRIRVELALKKTRSSAAGRKSAPHKQP